MPETPDIDVIVGGGGVAGVAAAAAIQQLGYNVMVVEPGQRDERRLAGEVFHPPGVSGLADLGLLAALSEKPAVNVSGFYISCESDCIRLPYDTVPAHRSPGLCLEHSLIRERMLSAVSALPNVTVKRGARVVEIDQSHPSHVVVGVANGAGSGSYRCRMFVVADGSPSRLARLAGIAVHNRLISTVWGYRIGAENLPQREFGHVFLGAATPILLYPIGRDKARILFDIPYRSASRPTAADCLALAQTLPRALREEVTHTIETQQRMSVLTRATTTDRIARGRVVLVGDAGGSCHPLTATGMTMCVNDALLLRNALGERAGDLPAALQLYQRRRRWPQATRLVLADTLRDAFCGTSPELRVVQGGILALWRGSAVARSSTLALLSTADGRPFALIRQIIAVTIRGFVAHLRNPKPENRGIGVVSVARSLFVMFFRNVRQVLSGAAAVAREDAAGAPEHASPDRGDQPRSPRTIAR
jgi:2-polyprenyl-6-methoxyphenol hydroxylase-like FAD-dependent oxidoreductase